MKKINGRWVDKNNNSWSSTLETEESALAKSKSLINCFNCSGCSDCSCCSGCSGCFNCFDCSGCFGCFGCSDFKENPCRYVTVKCGSRNSQTMFYWLAEQTQVICGCFTGTLSKFEVAVKEMHGDNDYAKQYEKQIALVKMLMETSK